MVLVWRKNSNKDIANIALFKIFHLSLRFLSVFESLRKNAAVCNNEWQKPHANEVAKYQSLGK